MPYGSVEVRPTKKGVALRIREWVEFLRVVELINDEYPDLGKALPCYMGECSFLTAHQHKKAI